jgi:hypothetical protein
MESDKEKILRDKIIILIKHELERNKFQVLSIDVFFDLFPTKPGQVINIDNYDVFLDIDYDGPLDGYEPYSFASNLKDMCEKVRDSISEYVITSEGKITTNKDNILVSDAMIVKIDYKIEETHKFTLSFKIAYDR